MQLIVTLECTAKLNGNGYEYGYELEMPKNEDTTTSNKQ